MTFSQLITAQREGDRFFLNVPDQWQQGRGAFGGLVLASLSRTCELVEAAPDRTLRSITGQICAPVQHGETEVVVERLRTGSGLSTLAARLMQSGETVAHAVCQFAKRKVEDADWNDLTPPAIPDWRSLEVLPVAAPFGPVFAQHFEFRSLGPLPFSGDVGKEASGFVRFKTPGHFDAHTLVGLLDAWWPLAITRFTAPRPIGTIAYTAQILDTIQNDAPLFYRGRADVSRDGYSVEFRELWSADGRLLALNQQTIAIIK
jgi:acyl-CoA thioesterase